tara:strand:+ start:14614 stop:14979 length:366 start_codon:yes stop_codon:yes gene_type:complete
MANIIKKSVTITDIDTSYTGNVAVTVPECGRIVAAAARITAGSGSSISIAVSEKTGSTDASYLAYASAQTACPWHAVSDPPSPYVVDTTDKTANAGVLYVSGKAGRNDDTTAVITLYIEII